MESEAGRKERVLTGLLALARKQKQEESATAATSSPDGVASAALEAAEEKTPKTGTGAATSPVALFQALKQDSLKQKNDEILKLSHDVSKLQQQLKEKEKQIEMFQTIATRYKSHMTESDRSVRFLVCFLGCLLRAWLT